MQTTDEKAMLALAEKLENLKSFLNKAYTQNNIDQLFNKALMYVRDVCNEYNIEYDEIIHDREDLTVEFICPFQYHWLHLHVRCGALYIQLY